MLRSYESRVRVEGTKLQSYDFRVKVEATAEAINRV